MHEGRGKPTSFVESGEDTVRAGLYCFCTRLIRTQPLADALWTLM